MPHLSSSPTLAHLQAYVAAMEVERGFDDQDAVTKCFLLGEEIGELFKAVRKSSKMRTDPNSKVGSVADELADVLIHVCAIANRFHVDLEQAFRDKEARNSQRIWSVEA